jgi:TM2 domain-containing membrane protein YozV
MNTKQLALYELNKKSTPLAYLLGLFFGLWGLHLFYLKKTDQAIIRFMLFVISLVIPPVMMVSVCVFIFDGFYTYYVAEEYNRKMLEIYGDE